MAAVALPPFVKPGVALKSYTRDEVKSHSTASSLWTVVDSYVLTKFVDMHPGGAHVLLHTSTAGVDSTDAFFGLHRSEVLVKYSRYLIGQIANETATFDYPTPGALSRVPNAEPPWLGMGGMKSMYYTDDHRKLALAMRDFVDNVIAPEARIHELTGKPPSAELVTEMGRRNILHMRLGPGPHLHGLTLPGGMRGEDFNYMAELVVTQEIARIGQRGYQDGLSAGMWIGLTPILNYGTPAQKAAIIPAVLRGEKHICLAISEPFAGSDVAGLQTTAELSKDGKSYLVNGVKKWITCGFWSDYASVAVKTKGGMSMLLIDLHSEGVDRTAIKTAYSAAAGTSLITFDKVVVPVENIIGEVDKGLAIVLSNFNHERLVMVHFTTRQIRLVTEQTFIWAHLRKVFGQSLIEQPVIRAKFAEMFAKCDAAQAQLEFITYQMDQMTYAQQSVHLAGPIALLKTYVTRIAHDIADDSVQIWGGRGLTKGGMGGMIEAFARGYKFDSILGGSEEILAQLGVRQASRKMRPSAL